jgi:probable phosphoglycerate mutase
MELLLIRHAQPLRIDDPGDRPADPELTDRGRDQAARLGRWLAPERIDAVWSSTQRRALETAAPIAAGRGLTVVEERELCEYDRDTSTYVPLEELKAERDPRWFALAEGRWQEVFGTDPESFRARIVSAVEAIVADNPGRRVAVVCHGGVINAYAGHVLGIDRPLWFDPGYASITRVFAQRDGVRSVHTLNEHPHLRDVPG